MSVADDETASFIWAVDTTFDPEINDYPEGYNGMFKVHPSALLHDLYVALGSHVMAPVDLWVLVQDEDGKGGDVGNSSSERQKLTERKDKHDEL